MAGILFIMTFLWLYSGIKYLAEYRRTYSDGHEVYDVYSLIEKLKLGDIAFTKAFNQTILNIILVLCLSVFVVYKTLSIDGAFASTWAFAIPDILLYGAQIGILANYLKKIIDLEMDFNIVRKGAIFFFNQSMFSGSGTEVAYEKIKTRSFSYDSMGGKMF